MIYRSVISGLPVQTGDILCTRVGDESLVGGLLWRTFGALVPGPIDHMALYVGPDGRCVESGPAGVVDFDVSNRTWGAQRMARERARNAVAAYCLAQAEADRPYNFNFLNSHTEKSFYCTHLIYQAYLHSGIDLNSQQNFLGWDGQDGLILPQEIWQACEHRRVEAGAEDPVEWTPDL